MATPSIGVIGAGAWGTSLSAMLARRGYTIRLWSFEVETVHNISEHRVNTLYLPGIPLPETIYPTHDLLEVVKNCRMLVMAVPSQHTRNIARKISNSVTKEHRIVIASKGIETGTGLLMSEIYDEEWNSKCSPAVLSGPTFALETARELPSAAVLACENDVIADSIQRIFHSSRFRLYRSRDLLGVQVAGAVKNVLSIASGIADGMVLGFNARAALICRGLTEMTRLGTAMGGLPETFAGMSGLGDLVLTATGPLSRNHSLGVCLGKGKSLNHCLAGRKVVTEGVSTSVSLQKLAQKYHVEMPICETVYRILHEDLSCSEALSGLLERELPSNESYSNGQ